MSVQVLSGSNETDELKMETMQLMNDCVYQRECDESVNAVNFCDHFLYEQCSGSENKFSNLLR